MQVRHSMVYSLLFRVGKNSQLLFNRAHFTWPVQTPALHQFSAVFNSLHTSPNPALSSVQQHGALCGHRSLHVGSFCQMRDQKEQKVPVTTRDPSSGLSAAQKVKQAGTDVTYLIVVLVGLGVTGGLLYVIFQELFSSSSPSKLYGKAFNKCRSHPEVIGAFGEPIKGYGETSRRGRRQQVSHAEYMKDGQKHMRMKFYIEGSEPGLRGTVHSDSRENPETGKYEFRYIFVDVDAYPRRTIVIEDNR